MPVVTCHEEHGAIATIKKWLWGLENDHFPPYYAVFSLFWRKQLRTPISLYLAGAFLAWNIPKPVVTCHEVMDGWMDVMDVECLHH